MRGRIIDGKIQAIGPYFETELPDWINEMNFMLVSVVDGEFILEEDVE